MLQAAVQAVNWTYCLFWQLCPEKQRYMNPDLVTVADVEGVLRSLFTLQFKIF